MLEGRGAGLIVEHNTKWATATKNQYSVFENQYCITKENIMRLKFVDIFSHLYYAINYL